MTTLTISLPEPLREFIDTQVKNKGYENASEYFQRLLREAQEREENQRLEALLIEGLDTGGDDIEVNEQFWKAIRAEAAELVAQRKSSA